MKVFTSEGVEKPDNSAVLVELDGIATSLRTIRSYQEVVTKELQIANLHFTIMNDQEIEEPP